MIVPTSTLALVGLLLGPILSLATESKVSLRGAKCPGVFATSLQKRDVVTFSMAGDFQKAKEISAGGNWTGEDRSWDQYGVPVSIAWSSSNNGEIQNHFVEALMRVRGMSSADVAEFPKLKVKLPKDASGKNSLFDGANGFRINTSGFHNEPLAPFREALAYELAEVLGMPTPKIRRAFIDYNQKNKDGSLTKINERQALLIENDKPLLKRLNADDVSQDFVNNLVQVDTDKAGMLFVYNALISNEDIGLRVRKEPTMGTETYKPLFNTMALKTSDSKLAEPLVYDLDKSEIVGLNGYNEVKMSTLFGREISGQEARMLVNLSRLRQRFTAAEIDWSIQKVLLNLPRMRALVKARAQENLIDAKAAAQIYRQFTWFENFTSKLSELKITLKETPIYQQPKAANDLSLLPLSFSDELIGLRPGTPVKVLGQSADGKFLKVVILDTHYEVRSDLPQQQTAGIGEYIGYIDAKTAIGLELAIDDLGYANELDMAYH